MKPINEYLVNRHISTDDVPDDSYKLITNADELTNLKDGETAYLIKHSNLTMRNSSLLKNISIYKVNKVNVRSNTSTDILCEYSISDSDNHLTVVKNNCFSGVNLNYFFDEVITEMSEEQLNIIKRVEQAIKASHASWKSAKGISRFILTDQNTLNPV